MFIGLSVGCLLWVAVDRPKDKEWSGGCRFSSDLDRLRFLINLTTILIVASVILSILMMLPDTRVIQLWLKNKPWYPSARKEKELAASK